MMQSVQNCRFLAEGRGVRLWHLSHSSPMRTKSDLDLPCVRRAFEPGECCGNGAVGRMHSRFQERLDRHGRHIGVAPRTSILLRGENRCLRVLHGRIAWRRACGGQGEYSEDVIINKPGVAELAARVK